MSPKEDRRTQSRRADDPPTPVEARILRQLRYVIFVVGVLFLLLLAVGTIGFVRINSAAGDASDAADDATAAFERVKTFAGDIRDAAVGGCQRQNKVRKRQHEIQDIMRAKLRDENYDARHPDPAILKLLHLAPEDVSGVSDKQIAQNQQFRQELNHKLALAPCQDVYPSAEASDGGK